MWWAIRAVVLATFVCSVISTEANDGEPRLRIMARSTVYNVGETKAIFCQGMNIQETIDWYKPSGDKVMEKSSENNKIYVERKNDTAGPLAVLIMHNIVIKDSGNWTCKAGELSETREFIVGEKVNITDRNVTMEGEEGRSIKLTCEAKGHPPPVVVWYRDNSIPIPNDIKKYVIKPDNTLEIKKLNHMDVGVYVCKVRQKALSHYTDKTVQLSVQHKPILYNSFTQAVYTTKYKTEEVYAILNEIKNITCSAIANPPPVYRWFRRINGYDSDSIVDSESVITSDDGTNSVLVLRMYDESFLGEYKCSANNSRGQESIVFHVSLGTKPDPPDFVTLVGSNVTYLTFNVTCSTCVLETEDNISPNPENLTVTGYSFQLTSEQVNYPPDWDVAQEFIVNIDDPENTLFTIGPLPNSTTFHAQVRTRNAAGFSEWVPISPNPATTDDATRLGSAFAMIILASVLIRCY